MKKICIIGGGSAGLCAEISLQHLGIESVVCERLSQWGPGIIGFILLENGLLALDRLGIGDSVRSQGYLLREFVMRSERGREIFRKPLGEVFGIKRDLFLRLLRQSIGAHSFKTQMNFSHFEYDRSERAVSAYFTNGAVVEADLFLGCDGVHSKVRKNLFPEQHFHPFPVREFTCLVRAPEVVDFLKDRFLKTQREEGGLALGLVPCSPTELIWYMQFDSIHWNLEQNSASAKQSFIEKTVGGWPEPIPTVLQKTDFSQVHLWSLAEMDPLPQYHKNNVALVGDAAHLFLPFTSQGVNSALHDAVSLAEELAKHLDQQQDLEASLREYSREHHRLVERVVQTGHELAERFLHPQQFGAPMLPIAK